MKAIEKICYNYYTGRYGGDLPSRFRKFRSEIDELDEAFRDFMNATDPADRDKKREHLIDELGDVQTILSHISSIIGVSHEELLINTLVKNKVREIVPEYMKGEQA